MSGVLERSGKYYTTATCRDSINNIGNGLAINIYGVRFSVWSNSGQLLYDTVFQRADSGKSAVFNRSIQELPNHTFLVAGDGGDTKGHVKLFLFCFDSMARPLWQKEWDKPADFPMLTPFDDWLMADFKPDGHGNYLMLSSIGRGMNSQTLLMKLDSSFNEIWHKDFGDNKYNSIAQSLVVENEGYTFGGYYSNINRTTKFAFYQTELFKTDTSGNLKWHWREDTLRVMSQPLDLIKTKDGGYIYCGSKLVKREFYPQTSLFYWRPWIEKIDSSGKTIWSDTIASYATDYDRACFTKLIELPDGDIAATGMITSGFEEKDTGIAFYGVLEKFAPNGKLKWRRKYDYHGDTMYYRLYDIKHTSDGGYVMAGHIYEVLHKTSATLPWQRAWLLKVDSNGCTSTNDPQCWAVGVPQEPKLAAGSYQVYPNPAAEAVSIRYAKEDPAEELFSLYDITRRLCAHVKLAGREGQASLPLAGLRAGVYVYRVSGGGKGIRRPAGRLVVRP